jgi:hypothetical protein
MSEIVYCGREPAQRQEQWILPRQQEKVVGRPFFIFIFVDKNLDIYFFFEKFA